MSTTARSDWPTQVRLPGQTAAPEGPVDLLIMYVMHRGFRADLDRFVEAFRATPSHDRTAWAALDDRWGVLAEILHHHHSVEDDHLWPRLRARCEPEERATLDAMEEEHEEIDPMLESVAESLAHLRRHDDEDARAALSVRMVAARERLLRHLEHEETESLAILQRVFDAVTYAEFEEEERRAKRLTPRQAARLVPWAAQNLTPEVRERAMATAGLPFRIVWYLSRRGWARRERAAFAYA